MEPNRDRWRVWDTTLPVGTLPRETHMADLGLVRLAFALGSEVRIRGKDLRGFVVTASVTVRGVLYQVAYWNDNTRTEVWFEEFELEALA